MRFRAEQHLRRASEIRAVRERGRRVECRAFTVWWKQRDAVANNATAAEVIDGPRACVIASTAAVGIAVRRNRAKRRLREVFRQHQDAVPRNCDLLLIARGAVVDCPLAELEQRFAEACRKIGGEIAPPKS